MKMKRLLVLAISVLLVLNASVCRAFRKSPNDTENPVHLLTGWQPRGIHHEPGWQRKDESHKTPFKRSECRLVTNR